MRVRKKLTPDVMRFSGRYPAGVLENPEPIAQRFAHSPDLPKAALRAADPPRVPRSLAPKLAAREETVSAARSAGLWHWLIAGLVSVALPLCLILGIIGLASTGGVKPPIAHAPKRQPSVPSAVLTTATRLEAKAGDTIGFPIALDGTDGVPARSIIAITGLPQASNFSDGRPLGESEWILKPDQIGDLHLGIPRSTNGEFNVAIELIGPDDKVIAKAGMLLAVVPATPLEPIGAEVSDAATLLGGEAASLDEEPAESAETAETAATPEAVPAADEQTQETAAPTRGAQPNTLGQADTKEAGFGTVQPSVYVNMREAPKSSSPVLGVIAKEVQLEVLDRKRGWVKVTDPANGKQGWIYSGLLAGEAKAHRLSRRAAPAEAEPKSESFWGRVGRWLTP
jgi:hypothetical protein